MAQQCAEAGVLGKQLKQTRGTAAGKRRRGPGHLVYTHEGCDYLNCMLVLCVRSNVPDPNNETQILCLRFTNV